MASPSVLVVGAGISGLACARSLQRHGATVRVVDRGRRPGGRMSGRTLHGRTVDLGASYFTAEPGSDFEAVVREWLARGVAREWTDTFASASPEGIGESKSGPMRYAAPAGLRELVTDLGSGLELEQGRAVARVDLDGTVDGTRYDAVVLAMPDPQAVRLLPDGSGVRDRLSLDWEPTIAVALGWEERQWSADLHGAFVNDSGEVSFIADDGDRRGDAAPVLVAHSTPELAARHLEEPEAASAPIARAVADALGISEPASWTHTQRWSFARTSAPHDEPFLLEGGIGVCGDAWGGKSSVGAAWTSGDALGTAVAASLGHAG